SGPVSGGPSRSPRLPVAERLRSLAGPAARNGMSRKAEMPARSSATPGSSRLLLPRYSDVPKLHVHVRYAAKSVGKPNALFQELHRAWSYIYSAPRCLDPCEVLP